jgi:WD40 repeat protein
MEIENEENIYPSFSVFDKITNCHSDTITSISFTSNKSSKKLLATGSNDKFVKIFEINNEEINESTNSEMSKNVKEKWKYQYHIFGINKIKFNSDNKYLLSGGNDCQVNIVDINSQNLLRNFRVESIVTSLDINYSNNILSVGTYDYLMYLFDIRTRNCICKMICHSEPITDVKFSEDSTVIYSTSYDSFFRIWDMFRFSPLKTFSLENSPSINNVLLLENENYVLLNNFNSSLEIMDVVNEIQIKKFWGHKHCNFCTDCCLYTYEERGKRNDLIFTGDEEGNICYYNVRKEGNKCNKISIKDKIKCDNNNDNNSNGNNTNNKNPIVVNCLDILKNNENPNDIIACSVMGDLNNSILLLKQDK